MLLAIREKVTGVVALIVVAVISVFMIVPMLYEYVAGTGDNSVIDINGESISALEFNNELSRTRQQLAQVFGGQIPEYFENEDFLKEQTIERVIYNHLLNQATVDEGYHVNEDLVANLIMELPEFQNEGRFDRTLYQRQLQSRGYNESRFERDFSDQILRNQLQDGVTKTAFSLEFDLRRLAELRYQTRTFDLIKLSALPYRERQTVEEQEIVDYHQLHATRFQHPEKVDVEYVELIYADYMKNIEATDEMLEAEYAAGIEAGRYQTPEVRTARHILLKVDADDPKSEQSKRQQAKDLVERLRNGEDFAELAKKFSEDTGSAAKGGDLGEVARGVMVSAFEDAVYSQEQGIIGEPVKTRFGFHIIRVDSIDEARQTSYADVKEEIRKELIENQAREEFDADLEEIANIAFESAQSLQPIADQFELLIKTSGLFTRGSGTGIASDPGIREAAFRPDVLIEGHNSSVLEIESGNKAVILRLKEHLPRRKKTLEEAREEIKTLLLDQKTAKAVKDAANTIRLALLERQGEIAEIAKEYDGQLENSKSITRNNWEGLSRELIESIFRMRTPEHESEAEINTFALPNKGYAVVVLKQVTAGVYDKLDKSELDALAEEIVGVYGRADFTALMDNLRERSSVKISQQLEAIN